MVHWKRREQGEVGLDHGEKREQGELGLVHGREQKGKSPLEKKDGMRKKIIDIGVLGKAWEMMRRRAAGALSSGDRAAGASWGAAGAGGGATGDSVGGTGVGVVAQARRDMVEESKEDIIKEFMGEQKSVAKEGVGGVTVASQVMVERLGAGGEEPLSKRAWEAWPWPVKS